MRLGFKLFIGILLASTLWGCSASGPPIVKYFLQPNPATPVAHWVQTDDNWSLHILRYKPAEIDPNRVPVILCHGLSHNNTFWDLTEKASLAQYLQREGFDVWSVSLRGSGQSTKPTISQIKQLFRLNISALNPQSVINRQPGMLRLNWTVDDHINHDIPAVIDYVLKETQNEKVIWVGHSMGAMIMFAYLGLHPDAPVKGFVGISAPMYLVHPANDVLELLAGQESIVQLGNLTTGTHLRAVVGVLAGDMVSTPVDQLFMNQANVDPQIMRTFYYANQDDISPGQLDQLLRFIRSGNFSSIDGEINYTENVKNITLPVLQVVGQMDNFIAPGFVAEIHRRLGSKDKQMRVFGQINGYRADYGHDDIILGRYAGEEVFPYLTGWLKIKAAKTEKSPLLPELKLIP
jgi:pimeloyl-ACP methyl ester carboxylesterase